MQTKSTKCRESEGLLSLHIYGHYVFALTASYLYQNSCAAEEYSKKTTSVVFYKTFYRIKTLTSVRDRRPHCQAKHTTMIERNQK